jgi:hypothetical protein
MTALFNGTAFAWSPNIDSSGPSRLRLTLFPDSSHDAWSRAYADRGMWDWTFAQRSAGADPGASCGGDGGVTTDSGIVRADAGATTDGAVRIDAGTATDSAVQLDSGTPADVAQSDAPRADGAISDSAGTDTALADAASASDTQARDGSDGGTGGMRAGCGCAIPGSSDRPGRALATVIALAFSLVPGRRSRRSASARRA